MTFVLISSVLGHDYSSYQFHRDTTSLYANTFTNTPHTCMHSHMYIYVCIHICLYIYMIIHHINFIVTLHLCMWIHSRTHRIRECIHIYIYMYVYTYVYTYIWLFIISCSSWHYILVCECIHICKRTHTYTHPYIMRIQVGEDSYNPLSCRSFSTKEPLNIGHFCGKWPIKIRDPMSLRHPVCMCTYTYIST